ncbi:hypothetical protein Sps_03235 [Shewanella psychrophila]|uniref:Uncharacterized protein n=1 Tax=Shewanella psychrophila TaxID=225848 RepID=A0A1S6HS55_9GAMM|nr:hypothetical protein Sps_03235 [Shewanella psychrophila]
MSGTFKSVWVRLLIDVVSGFLVIKSRNKELVVCAYAWLEGSSKEG